MARLDKTLADYIVIAISPVLIMLMVGSLLYFLAAISHLGSYWVLGWFTMAIVLIARISMDEESHERAIIYGGFLAFAVWIVLGRPASLILLGLAWWAAHQLTWDCTLIDEDQDSSGRGLLEIIKPRRRKKKKEPAAPSDAQPTEMPEPEGVTTRVDEMRAEAHPRRSPRKKPHAPGVWIVYFSLAALPLFGFGQGFIPCSDVEGRRWAFELFCVYVASGLGLLVTTSFLGLRRYLRQRGVEMPIDVAGVWVVLGAAIIVVLLVVAALLPRPAAEYAVSQFPLRFTLPERESSPVSVGNEGADRNRPEDEPRVQQRQEQGPPSQADLPESRRQPKESPQQQSGQEPGKEPGKESGKEPGGETGQESGQDRGAKSEAGEQGKQPSAETDENRKDSGRSSPPQKSTDRAEPGASKPAEPRRESSTPPGEEPQAPRDVRPREPGEKKSAAPPERRNSPARPAPKPQSPWFRLPQVSLSIGGFLKLILYAVVLGIVGYWVWRHWDRVKAAIQQFVREFWARLFGRKDQGAWELVEDEAAKQPRPRSFSDYADPFASGLARRSPPEQVVRYTFEAIEAWARENGCARDPDQTPHEFAREIARREESLSVGVKTLASLYSHVAYASGRPTAERIVPLAQLWQRLRAVTTPISQPQVASPSGRGLG